MKLLIDLFITFFKVGAMAFGGGYSIIAILGNYLEKFGWLSAEDYGKIVTISQMTPGPIAVNTATYVGAAVFSGDFRMSLIGAMIATLGVTLPSFFIIITAAKLFDKMSNSRAYNFSMLGIRPAVIGFMLSAILYFGRLAFITESSVDFFGIAIFLLCFFLSFKKKIGAITIILISAVIGMAVF